MTGEAVIKKLKRLNQKIQQSKVLNQELINIFTVDIYGVIQENQTLKNIFESRCGYLERLAKDSSFIALQEKLMSTIQAMLRLFDLKMVQKIQDEADAKLPEDIKKQIGGKNTYCIPLKVSYPTGPMSVTLPELYNRMLEPKNYFRLGDEGLPYGLDFELCTRTPTGAVIRQYKGVLEIANEILRGSKLCEKDNRVCEKYQNLKRQYKDCFDELKERAYFEPLKLHVKDYESFLLRCASQRSISEHKELSYPPFIFFTDQYDKLQTAQEVCDAVVTDLIETVQITKETTQPSQTESILQDEENRVSISSKDQPSCLIEGRFGFLKYQKHGQKIKIGFATSRHFRLLQCLCDPFGTARTIDSVFDLIKIKKDERDSQLNSPYSTGGRKVQIIRNAIKDLQKGSKTERLKFNLDQKGRKVWLGLLP